MLFTAIFVRKKKKQTLPTIVVETWEPFHWGFHTTPEMATKVARGATVFVGFFFFFFLFLTKTAMTGREKDNLKEEVEHKKVKAKQSMVLKVSYIRHVVVGKRV